MAIASQPQYDQGRCYYEQGWLRVEMAALGPLHGRHNAIVARVVSLFATLQNLTIVEFTNTSFRRPQKLECQPDSAFYVGENLRLPPRNNAPVDLNEYDVPTLVIEVASTSLSDDLGRKRLLYEHLGVQEYWVVDAIESQIYAFEVQAGRSGQIQTSLVLPGLAIATVEAALHRGQTEDDGAINRWLIEQFSNASSR
jgi:Uma2 family endonuclease